MAGLKDGPPPFITQSSFSLRDFFASQALALGGEYFHMHAATGPATVARCCYEIADAMLKAREAHS